MNLLLATLIGLSFSVRTPNDNVKPLDYEFSIKAEDKKGKFTYNLKRDWERELGEKYIDDVVKFSHQVHDGFYYGVDYVNKESKDIDYITYNIGATIDWFKAGVSFKEIDKEISPLLNPSLVKSATSIIFFTVSVPFLLSRSFTFESTTFVSKSTLK